MARLNLKTVKKALSTFDGHLWFLTSTPKEEEYEFIAGVADRLDRLNQRLRLWLNLHKKIGKTSLEPNNESQESP